MDNLCLVSVGEAVSERLTAPKKLTEEHQELGGFPLLPISPILDGEAGHARLACTEFKSRVMYKGFRVPFYPCRQKALPVRSMMSGKRT